MLISLKWLKEYVKIDENIKDLAHSLTMIGQEVESIKIEGEYLDNVVVGHIIKYGKHPNSDKLTLLTIDIGEEENLQIICGAPNHKLDDKVIVAKIGAILPGNFKIKKASIRDVESFGMLCSERELEIGINSDKIVILPKEAPIGLDIKSYLELNDVIFELEITPNRPDCLSHIGIAREIAAYYKKKIMYPKSDIDTITGTLELTVEIEDKMSCTRYTTRRLKNVKVTESPQWLKKRLKSIDIQPINNIVDVTNYVMFEYNQPIHAFDFNKLEGSQLTVRRAKKNETIVTLSGHEKTLNNSELIISDRVKPVAIAGIIGGENSMIDENSHDIILEGAYYLPTNIRKTSTNLGISTDSSYRFERGINKNNILEALNRAIYLIQSMTQCEVIREYKDICIDPYVPKEILLDIKKLDLFVGKSIDIDQIAEILNSLDMKTNYKNNNIIAVTPPSYRTDVTRSADLYEEIIRIYGFENIESKMPIEPIKSGKIDAEFKDVDLTKKLLKEVGLQEVINYSFIPKEMTKLFSPNTKTIDIINPIGSDMATLRPTLIYSLLSNVRDNFNKSINSLNIFEVSKTFSKIDLLINEKIKIGIAISGKKSKTLWNTKSQAYDFYDLKGCIETFFKKIGLIKYQLKRSTSSCFHQGRAVNIFVGKYYIGTFGEIHPDIAEVMSISKERVYVAELELDSIFKYNKIKSEYKRIIKYPKVNRDLSIVVGKDELVGNIMENIRKSSSIIETINLFDVYYGEEIGENKKSIAINLVLRKVNGTLKEAEIATVIDKILSQVKNKYKGEIRS